MVFTGIGASSGLALAPAFCLTPKQGPGDKASSRSFEEAREQLKRQYDQSIAALTSAGRRAEAEVLLCHREMVSDVLLEERVNQEMCIRDRVFHVAMAITDIDFIVTRVKAGANSGVDILS